MRHIRKILTALLLLAIWSGATAQVWSGVTMQIDGVSAVKRLTIQPSFSEYAKPYVEQRINEWQKKDEFEKTSDWQARVNEQTRREKIAELTKAAEREFISKYSSSITPDCTLGSYDADNEVYLITDSRFGNMLVPVPIGEAQNFKLAWNSMKITPEYFIGDDCLDLASASFGLPGSKSYTYSNQASLNYAVADVRYNFDPIEIDLTSASNPKGRQTISLASLSVGKSDVDTNIPQTEAANNKTFAVIIANENYAELAAVPYAINDGKTFGEYCRKTLGIPASNIRHYDNATYGKMLGAMQDIRNIADTYNGDVKVLFYYAGHGAPNESTKEAHLIPVDAYGAQSEVSYPLSRLYKELSGLKASSVTVFLDACFSGATRDDKMLASARGVAIKAKADMPMGNLVVFSASSDDETALSYIEKGHGLFTYYLLKKLQTTSGDVTLGELGDYISTNVARQSIVVNRKSQTPTVNPGLSFGAENWKTLKLR